MIKMNPLKLFCSVSFHSQWNMNSNGSLIVHIETVKNDRVQFIHGYIPYFHSYVKFHTLSQCPYNIYYQTISHSMRTKCNKTFSDLLFSFCTLATFFTRIRCSHSGLNLSSGCYQISLISFISIVDSMFFLFYLLSGTKD